MVVGYRLVIAYLVVVFGGTGVYAGILSLGHLIAWRWLDGGDE